MWTQSLEEGGRTTSLAGVIGCFVRPSDAILFRASLASDMACRRKGGTSQTLIQPRRAPQSQFALLVRTCASLAFRARCCVALLNPPQNAPGETCGEDTVSLAPKPKFNHNSGILALVYCHSSFGKLLVVVLIAMIGLLAKNRVQECLPWPRHCLNHIDMITLQAAKHVKSDMSSATKRDHGASDVCRLDAGAMVIAPATICSPMPTTLDTCP